MSVKDRKVQYYFILVLFFFHFELVHSSAQSGDTLIYYVANNGNDSWSGLLANPTIERDDGPFATLEKAREIIASKIEVSDDLRKPINVQIREGVYVLDTTFRLSFPFSGTARAPILFSSYPEEEVSIIGGVKISGFQPISDTTVLKRISNQYHDSILHIDLKTLGITNYGTLMPRGFPRPFYPSALELFFNNQPMQLARWPNEGWATIASTNGKDRFVYSDNRPARWQTSKDVWLHGFWGRDWADSHVAIKQIDTAEKVIITHEPHGTYGYKKGGRYYALNVLEELDEPGEWYLNRDIGILYFWPPSPQQEAEIYISLQETPLVELDSTAYIHFHDLTFEISRGLAFLIKNGANNTISKSILRNLGKYAVDIRGGYNNGLIACDIYNTGEGGIRISGGDREQIISAHHYAINNHIYHYNRWVKTYRPAIHLAGVGHVSRQNLIHDAPHFAIQIQGNEHLIELNEIFRVGLETGDASAFYMGRDWTMRGNIVRHNYFHQLKSTYKLGIMGVYLDDGASGLFIDGNIFYDVQRAVLIGGGRDNFVENNVFLNCDLAVYMDGRVMLWKDLDKTLIKRLQNVPYQEDAWKEKYPTLASILENEPNCPQGNIISNNISINTKWINSRKETADYKQMVGNRVFKKSKIINPKTLSVNQKVINKLNLQIPVDKIGLQHTDMRASWPDLPSIRRLDK